MFLAKAKTRGPEVGGVPVPLRGSACPGGEGRPVRMVPGGLRNWKSGAALNRDVWGRLAGKIRGLVWGVVS